MFQVKFCTKSLFFILLFSNVCIGQQGKLSARLFAWWQEHKAQNQSQSHFQPQVKIVKKKQPNVIVPRKNAWRGVRGVQPGIAPTVGLVNNGALCYQNATLQAIHKCPELYRALMSKIESNMVYLSTQLVAGLHDVFTQLDGQSYTYNPKFFADEACKLLFDGQAGQQDAQEFLAGLWGHLQTQAIFPDTTPPAGTPIDPAYSQWSGLNIRKRLKCHTCKQKRYTPSEISFILPLALQPRAKYVETLFSHFKTPQKLTGEEMVDCLNCHARTNHTEQILFTIAPEMRYLVLHIKRFQGFPANKIETPIVFSPSGRVDIIDSDGVNHPFSVASVVVHSGNVGFGHYKCLTKDGIYNDSRVQLDNGAAMHKLLVDGEYDYAQGYLYFLERLND